MGLWGWLPVIAGSLVFCGSVEAVAGDDCKDSQSCLYQRANDVLILQANYLFSKATEVAALKSQGSGAIYSELGKFCELGGPAADPGAKPLKRIPENRCLENYLLLAKKGLREIRTAISRNEDSIVQLASKNPATLSGAVGSDNGPLGSRGPGVQEVPRDWTETLSTQKPLIPDLLVMDPILKKLDDLQRTRGLTRAGRDNMDQELLSWWDEFPKCPDRDEFIAVEQVERFPKNPTGEKLRRVKLKPDGKVEHDEKAFAAALSECQSKRADWVRSGPAISPAASGSGPNWLGKEPSPLSRQVFEGAQKRLADCVGGRSRGGTSSGGAPKGVVLCGNSTGSAPTVQSSSPAKFRALQLADEEFKRAEREIDLLLSKAFQSSR